MGEKEIISLCLQNDRKGQRELVNTYLGYLLGVARRYCRDDSTAEDVVQEAFIKIFENLSSFKSGHQGALKAWMRRIVINTALQDLRKPYHRLSILDTNDMVHLELDAHIIDRLSEKELLAVIDSLPEGYKEVFCLHVIDGFSHKEIGNVMGLEEASSRSRLSRAKIILRKKLSTLMNVAV